MRKQVGLQGEKVQAIKELSSFFNAVRQAVFHFKPNGFDSRKAKPQEMTQHNLHIPVPMEARNLPLILCEASLPLDF